MNRRKGTVLLIATLMIVGMIMVFPPPVAAADPPTVTVEFPNTTSSSVNEYDVCNTFRVNVTVDSNNILKDVWSWQSGIRFDPSILECTGVGIGDFFIGWTISGSFTGTIDNVGGTVAFSGAGLMAPHTEGKVGTGTLVWYDIHVKGYGSCLLNLTDTTDTLCGTGLWTTVNGTSAPTAIGPTTLTDGSFSNTGLAPGALPPTANFLYDPTTIYENDIVSFNGNLSTGGFDNNTMSSTTITQYYWDFNGDGTVDLVTADPEDPNAEFNFTTAGDYDANLTVYAANTAGSQYEWDTEIKTLTVYPKLESYIDLYTYKEWLGRTTSNRERGSGPGFPGSAFAAGETVTLRTYAYFMGYPVVDLNVGFRVTDPVATLLSSQSGITGIAGRAEVDFRLRQAPLPPFGAYDVISTARMFETNFNDTLKFNVNWIIKINSVTATNVEVGNPTTVTVNVTNYDPYDAYLAYISVSAFDVLNVLANTTGQDESVTAAVTPAAGTDGPAKLQTFVISLYIPDVGVWPGPATVKVNAFTEAGGVAYCPEVTDSFSITAP